MKTHGIRSAFFLLTLVSLSFGQFNNFISVQGDKLMDGTKEFRFISYNIPNLHYLEDNFEFTNPNPWILPDEFEIRDALMAVKQSGGQAARIYVMSARKSTDEKEIIRHVNGPGNFDEQAFKTLDLVMKVANETGIRLIIPFVDNWWWWGGPREYAEWRGKSKEVFWSDSVLIADVKTTVAFLVNRTNTYTGVRYKDDKAILCWETGNELETTFEWSKQIAALVKQLDTNHLVMRGTHQKLLTPDFFADPNIDIVTTHHYAPPKEMVDLIVENSSIAKGRKPYIVGEFGFQPEPVMREVLDTVISRGISGAMVWSLRFRNRNGGFYYHTNAYRWPGFVEGQNWEEQAVMKLFYEKGFQIAGKKPEPIPVPASPKMLPIETPFKISWQGSAGATSYTIERRDADGGAWRVIAAEASDAAIGYRPLYSDGTAEVGKQYFYRVSAKNATGISAPSAIAGPVSTEYLMLIDEMENDDLMYGRMGDLQYRTFSDLSKAKEDRNRLSGKKGDFIVYRMPNIIEGFTVDAFAVNAAGKDLKISIGQTAEAFKPAVVTKTKYPNFKNDYNMFLPIRYSVGKLAENERFIKIELNENIQIGRIEFRHKRGAFKISPLFSDNMVLQQNAKVPVWGKGVAGASITVKPSFGKAVITKVNAAGEWSAALPTPKAGGPYEITVAEYDTVHIIRNVMLGEVWLASGQSNMEMPLEGWPPADTIMGSRAAIENSKDSSLRFFTVPRTVAVVPQNDVKGMWSQSDPQSARTFSATAYFFAKKLRESLKVPVGIIHASWGGTPVEAWISGRTISALPNYRQAIEDLRQSESEMASLTAWLGKYPTVDMTKKVGAMRFAGMDFQDKQCSDPSYNDSRWKTMQLPIGWEQTEVGNFDGVIWFRRSVEIPRAWVGRKLTMELGPIDDIDVTFVNGVRAGGYEGEGFWKTDRVYNIPDGAVKEPRVMIAVRVTDTQGGGGIFGSKEQMKIRLAGTDSSVSLAGGWKYLPVADYRSNTFTVYGPANEEFYTRPHLKIDPSAYTPSTLFNGMISPLLPYTIGGAIWYQGEANVGRADEYQTLFPMMIRQWRDDFKSGTFPFMFAQIAPWKYSAGSHSELLREAQLNTLSLKNTGMAVTLDIGNNDNIHPAKKEEVGQRLALLALNGKYGRKIAASGPEYSSMKIEQGKIVLTFKNIGGGLVLKGNSEFMIAGADKKFVPATAVVKGSTLIVSHPDVAEPAAVRYAFTDTSSAELFNKEGFPSSSFRTDRWK
ncbi:MAG: sialate O-acetylesterase [Bacteroidota bacterium]